MRLRRAHGLSRQSQAPLVVIGMVCALAAAADQLVWAIGTPEVRQLPGALARNLSAALVPVALMADLLRRRSAAADVSHRILTAALTGGAAEVQQSIRTVFVDRSATVELPDGRGGWLDTNARPVPPAVEGTRRYEALTLDDGSPLLRIGLDPRAVQDESLISTAVEAVRIGTHNTRLRAELLAAMSELGNSRERIVEAGLAERRRVERNLHDGAQQQLLAVAATLAQTDYVADDEVRGVVSRARATLSDALAELRALARGIHPPALSQGGLPIALPALCERAPWPVELRVDPETRDLPDAIEAATYFVIAEALTNAVRHASAHKATVEVHLDGPAVRINVADDGQGGARIHARWRTGRDCVTASTRWAAPCSWTPRGAWARPCTSRSPAARRDPRHDLQPSDRTTPTRPTAATRRPGRRLRPVQTGAVAAAPAGGRGGGRRAGLERVPSGGPRRASTRRRRP